MKSARERGGVSATQASQPKSAAADWLAGLALLVVVGALTLGPVVYVLVESIDISGIGERFRFGLDGWSDLATSPRTLDSIGYSLLLSLRAPLGVAIAFVIAWLLARADLPAARFIEISLLFGFFLPLAPMTMGWVLLLDANYGLLNALAQSLPFVSGPIFSIYSVPGIMWVHLSLTTIPIMVMLLTPAFRQFDASYEEAAEMAGASGRLSLARIALPLLAPAALTALIAGFIRSLETFEVEQLLGVPANIYVYATRIFEMINREPPLFPQAMALSSLFLALLFALAFAYQLYLRRVGARATLTGKLARARMRRRAWAPVVSAILIAYVCFSIFLPLAMLVAGSLSKIFGFFFIDEPWTFEHWIDVFTDDRFVSASINSISLGALVGLLGVLLFALAAWAIARGKYWSSEAIGFLVWLPWAIPGLVLGLTMLSLLLNTPGLNRLYGTLAPLVLALLLKELPIGVQMIRAAIDQSAIEFEEAGKMAGAGFVRIFMRVILPLAAPTLVSVFLLVFAGVVRDIATVVLIAAPGTRTLSLLMLDFAASGRFELAAVVGVIIALIALAITGVAFRLGRGRGLGA